MPSLYLLDTNALSDAMADHPGLRARLIAQPGQVGTSAVVQGEIRYGLERLPAGRRRTDLTRKAEQVFQVLPIEPVQSATSDIYARIRRGVELGGWNMDDNDLWIAATALLLGATLVTRDKAFSQVPGLKVDDWTQ